MGRYYRSPAWLVNDGVLGYCDCSAFRQRLGSSELIEGWIAQPIKEYRRAATATDRNLLFARPPVLSAARVSPQLTVANGS